LAGEEARVQKGPPQTPEGGNHRKERPMRGTWVLESHAAQALGIDPGSLDLPRCGPGISAEALWIDPRFIEARRSRDAIARQMAERRFNVELHNLTRMPDELRMMTHHQRSKFRKKQRDERASLV
jgi:hypothetical protein